MDVANENLLVIKKHNRKIVERAYQNSTVNANYQFPKRNIGQQAYSELSESLSMCSKVTETYDLNSQNAKHIIFQERQRKIAPMSSIFKIKSKNNDTQRLKTLLTSRQQDSGLKTNKRQFLSLTPKKSSLSKGKNSQSIEKTTGINLTKRKQLNFSTKTINEKDTQKEGDSLIKSLQKMASQCFGNQQNQQNKQERIEAVFYSEKYQFSKQAMTKKAKIALSDKLTADSTPLIGHQKTESIKRSKNKRGMSIMKLQQHVTVSPFLFP